MYRVDHLPHADDGGQFDDLGAGQYLLQLFENLGRDGGRIEARGTGIGKTGGLDSIAAGVRTRDERSQLLLAQTHSAARRVGRGVALVAGAVGAAVDRGANDAKLALDRGRQCGGLVLEYRAHQTHHCSCNRRPVEIGEHRMRYEAVHGRHALRRWRRRPQKLLNKRTNDEQAMNDRRTSDERMTNERQTDV